MKIIVPIVILVAGWFIGSQFDQLIGLSYAAQTSEWAPIAHNIAFGAYAIVIWETIFWILKK